MVSVLLYSENMALFTRAPSLVRLHIVRAPKLLFGFFAMVC